MRAAAIFLAVVLSAPAGRAAEVFAPDVISSAAHEGPFTFTPDGKTIYFVRLAAGMVRPKFFSSHLRDGRWTEPEPARFPEGAAPNPFFISSDGERLYYTHMPDAARRSRLWVADRDGEGWKNARPIGGALDTWDADQISPSVASDGTLYFTSSRAGGSGGWDIYRSVLKDGQYGEPQLLGGRGFARVSTPQNEASVTVAADGKRLVFSSAGAPNGFGGADLYLAELTGANGMVWAEHLGPAVNGAGDEIDPRLSADGQRLYYSRDGDVYEVELEVARRPTAASAAWKRIAETPADRQWPQVAAANGMVYVYGGITGGFKGKPPQWANQVEVFDPATKAWDVLPAPPAEWRQATLVAMDNRLFLFRRGGPGVAEYRVGTKGWEVKPASKPFTIGFAAPFRTRTVVLGRKAYTMFNPGGTRECSYFVDYDFDTGAWTPRRSLPFPAPQLAAANGRIYAFSGGADGNRVAIYDPAADSWSEGPRMEIPRWEAAVAVYRDEVWLIGGHGLRSGEPMDGDVSPTVLRFDPRRNVWLNGPDLPAQRAAAGAVEVNGRLLVFGGIRPGATATPHVSVLEYVPER
jgi:Tol biopolymer transport system component